VFRSKRHPVRTPPSRPAEAELLRVRHAADSVAPGREARARHALRRLHRILKGLSASERLELVLRYLAALQLDEVAALLAVPVRTVKRWVSQAPVRRDEAPRRPSDGPDGGRSGRARRVPRS
jgi:DNA-directed RNA polymerase specialized sigma24 family protein